MEYFINKFFGSIMILNLVIWKLSKLLKVDKEM